MRKGTLEAFTANQMLELLNRGEKLPTHYTCPIAVWQFGNDLTLVGLPGEVVVDYVALLEKALGPLNLWPLAYCNDVFGYRPRPGRRRRPKPVDSIPALPVFSLRPLKTR